MRIAFVKVLVSGLVGQRAQRFSGMRPVGVGAVSCDSMVSATWEVIRKLFGANRCPMSVVLYGAFVTQVDALLEDRAEIVWNTPVAWLDPVLRTGGACRAIAMRETGRGRVSHIVAMAVQKLGFFEKDEP